MPDITFVTNKDGTQTWKVKIKSGDKVICSKNSTRQTQ